MTICVRTHLKQDARHETVRQRRSYYILCENLYIFNRDCWLQGDAKAYPRTTLSPRQQFGADGWNPKAFQSTPAGLRTLNI